MPRAKAMDKLLQTHPAVPKQLSFCSPLHHDMDFCKSFQTFSDININSFKGNAEVRAVLAQLSGCIFHFRQITPRCNNGKRIASLHLLPNWRDMCQDSMSQNIKNNGTLGHTWSFFVTPASLKSICLSRRCHHLQPASQSFCAKTCNLPLNPASYGKYL